MKIFRSKRCFKGSNNTPSTIKNASSSGRHNNSSFLLLWRHFLLSGIRIHTVAGPGEKGWGLNGEGPTYEDVIDEELDKVENHQDGEEGVQVDIEGETPLHILQEK
jgi:hypothetical protein